ncbi:amidohydrolase family protein [Streptomyces sp. SL13]|uniref:Amidohydrolase family protein n=1 Tax=Streptantibioticus silvisoli TaxID=2705255 RepID=A0AA90H6I9_9ACTN|nr:amidohydrolase family protein [Streptantibioticus silvisoli]MDI5971845.1 amidohydrolase family protein [Streptantibioticus silvisoli]
MTESVPPQPHRPGGSGEPGDGPGAAPVLLLTGARLGDGRVVDVRLSGGRIEAVGTAGSLTAGSAAGQPPGAGPAGLPGGTALRDGRRTADGPVQGGTGSRVDLTGYLLLPAPAEPHAHLDTALTADPAGPPSDAAEDVQRRVTEAALLQLGHGATVVRTHVRVGDVQGLAALEAVLQAKRSLRGLVDLTAVAMPRLLTGAAGGDGLAVLRDAVKMGADVVGGCPDLDPDPTGYAEAALSVACEFGCPVDLHTDAADPARLARLTAMAGGLRPGVTLSGCAGLTMMRPEAARRAAGQLSAAGVAVVCLPQGGCGAPGRGGRPGGGHGPGVFRELRAAGVRVSAGSGSLRDAANPVGRGDPLEAAFLLASHGECGVRTAYDAVASRARDTLGLPEVRVEAGFPAELLAVRGPRLDAVLSLAYSRIVIHRGRVVSRTSAVREYADCDTAAALDLPRQSRTDT